MTIHRVPAIHPPVRNAGGHVTTAEDRALAHRLMAPLAGEFEQAAVFTMEGEPRSKARPRFRRGKGGKPVVYSSSKQVSNAKLLGWHFLTHVRKPLENSVGIAAIFYRSTRHRVDLDNLMKQLLDSANGICWRDDYQVTFTAAMVKVDPDRPRTVVIVGRDSTGFRDSTRVKSQCPTCGKRFYWKRVGSSEPRRFCSLKCASLSNGENLATLRACLFCGEDFKRRTAKQKMCSDECRLAKLHEATRARPKKPRKSPGTCATCGGGTSRPEYRRCRDCFRKGSTSA